MDYYTKLTTFGLNAIANAQVTGDQVVITHLAVGDGGGASYEPSQSQTELVNECWRGAVSKVELREGYTGQVTVEAAIPAEVGPFWIREGGLFDADGNLIAVIKFAPSEKTVAEAGSTQTLCVRSYLAITNTDSIELTIDPNKPWATEAWVNAQMSPVTTWIANVNESTTFGDDNVYFEAVDLLLDNEEYLQGHLIDGETIINIIGVNADGDIVIGDSIKVDADGMNLVSGVLKIGGTEVIDSDRKLNNITQANIDNIRVDGNTISSTNENGDIEFSPNGTGKIKANSAVNITEDGLEIGGIEVLSSDREITANKCNTPEIQDLLRSIQYDYVYNWDSLPENYSTPWTQTGGVTATVTDGVLTIDDTVTDDRCYYSLNTVLVPKSYEFCIIEHSCKETNASEAGAVVVAYFTNGSYGGSLSIYNDSVYLYNFNTATHSEIITGITTSEYNTYTICFNESYLGVYINGELKCSNPSISTATSSIIRFGTYSTTGTGKLDSEYFRYTVVGRNQAYHNNMDIDHTGDVTVRGGLSIIQQSINETILYGNGQFTAGEDDYVDWMDTSIGGQGYGKAFLRCRRDDSYGRAWEIYTCTRDNVSELAATFGIDSNAYFHDIFCTTNTKGMKVRNAAGSAYYSVISLDGDDCVRIGNSSTGNVRIHSSIIPLEDNTYDLGEPTHRFDDVYATNATIQTSDRRDKDNIDYDSVPGLALVLKVKPVQYKWKDYDYQTTELIETDAVLDQDGNILTESTSTEEIVTKRKTFSRSHTGFIAQDLEEALIDLEINTDNFAALIKSPLLDGGYKYGIRYNELIPIVFKSIQEQQAQISTLKDENDLLKSQMSDVLARVTALESST